MQGFLTMLHTLLSEIQKQDFIKNPPRTNLRERFSAINIRIVENEGHTKPAFHIKASVTNKTVVMKDIDAEGGSFTVEFWRNKDCYRNEYEGGRSLVTLRGPVPEPVVKKYSDLNLTMDIQATLDNYTALANEIYTFMFAKPE